MSIFKKITLSIVYCVFSFSFFGVQAAGPSSMQGSSKPYSIGQDDLDKAPKKDETKPQHYKQWVKPALPPMLKPFGMPGVIGLTNGRWEGTDYLGYLSNNIGIDVEIVKAENVPSVPDSSSIESRLAEIFTKENIVPRADVSEGPPLPFFHVLFLIYPVDKDRYVIFGNGRLFEQIQVIRKDFIPAGYWQGITWETQDIALSNAQQLTEQIKILTDKLGTAFAKRYRQYNISKVELPPGTQNGGPPPIN